MLFSGAVPRRPTNVARDTKERAWARARGAAVRAREGRNMADKVQTRYRLDVGSNKVSCALLLHVQ